MTQDESQLTFNTCVDETKMEVISAAVSEPVRAVLMEFRERRERIVFSWMFDKILSNSRCQTVDDIVPLYRKAVEQYEEFVESYRNGVCSLLVTLINVRAIRFW